MTTAVAPPRMPDHQLDFHRQCIQTAIALAEQSPPRPTNFRVGALLVDAANSHILTTGFTLELPGNTHAEQCCLAKFAVAHGCADRDLRTILPPAAVIYTTMEPCVRRLSGLMSCVDRIIDAGIGTVYHGVREPETFVASNHGRAKLEAAGVECVHVTGFEDRIVQVATAGHELGLGSTSASDVQTIR